MDASAFIAAALAPLAVWLLWRIQAICVDKVLRRQMMMLLRHRKMVYSVVSWFGTFLHEMSHATVLLLGGHGIKEFKVHTDHGHVLPRRVRRSTTGFLSFLAAAMAPMYLPPALVLASAWWLVDRGLFSFDAPGAGWRPALDHMEWLALDFPVRLMEALAGIDLATWQGALVFLLALVAIPGSRPSHVKGSRFHGKDDEGDIAVVRQRIRKNPWPFLLFLGVLYGLYFALTPFWPAAYWNSFQVVWSVALTGITLALFGAALWTVIGYGGRILPIVGWLPVLGAVAVQIVGRLDAWPWPDLRIVNLASLLVLAALTLLLSIVAPRPKFLR